MLFFMMIILKSNLVKPSNAWECKPDKKESDGGNFSHECILYLILFRINNYFIS